MIFIVVKFPVRSECVDDWLDTVDGFTQATRAEPGNLWFEWSRSVDDPSTFVLLEAFRDAAAGAEHVNSAHFKAATAELAAYLVKTPEVVNVEVPGDDWSVLAEMTVPDAS